MIHAGGLRRRSFLRMTAAGGLGLGFGEYRVLGAPTPNVKIVDTAGSTSLIFAKLLAENRYFEKCGVKAEISYVSDGSKILASLVSGGAGLCAGAGFPNLFPAIERGAKVKILAGVLLASILCIFSRRPDIRSTEDLIGKSVGIGAPGSLLHEVVVGLLLKKGIDPKQVKFVTVGSSLDVFKAVVAGTIDAGPSTIDFYDQQSKYGVHSLTDGAIWNELPNYTDQVMYASQEAIDNNRDALVRAMAAHALLFRFVSSPASRDAWLKARADALGKDEPAGALTLWNFFQQSNRLATNLLLSEDRITYVQDLNVRLGVQSKPLPLNQVADMSLARDALKLLS